MVTRRHLTVVLAVGAVAVSAIAYAAMSSGPGVAGDHTSAGDGPPGAEVRTVDVDATPDPDVADHADEDDDPTEPVVERDPLPEECGDRFLDPDRVVEGARFADCTVRAMEIARTHHLVRTTSLGVDRWDIVVAPELAITGTSTNPEGHLVVQGGTGWMDLGTGWIAAGAGEEPLERVVSLAVELAIATTSLDGTRAWLATAPEFTPLGTDEVDGHTVWGYAAEPEQIFEGVVTDAFEIWIDAAHLPVFIEQVTSVPGLYADETERWDYEAWGEEVEIVTPDELDAT